MDPLSIPNVTTAVLEQLFRVGDRTADFLSNFKDYDADTKALEQKLRDENNRTRALQMLLFEPSAVYNGNTLFEQFDTDVQDQIHTNLEQATGILGLAHELLNKRQGCLHSPSWTSDASTNVNVNLTAPPQGSGASTPTSSISLTPSKKSWTFQRFRWSLLDKKRVESIVREFSDYNNAIHDNIKLLCLGTSIGVNLQHLKRLEDNSSSRLLGFDVDTRLKIAATEAQTTFNNLEVDNSALLPVLTNSKLPTHRFEFFKFNGEIVLVEYRLYAEESPVVVELDKRTHDLVNRLANILCQPKEFEFRIAHCHGWVRQTLKNRIAFIFAIPQGVNPSPISLLEALSSKEREVPSISTRFQLALKLSLSIYQLHLVKWIHKSFRSENILLFQQNGHSGNLKVDFLEPWVFGFEFSRPEFTFSSGHADTCIERDIYRHPDRQKQPTTPFTKIHDIYALGVILLEIGLWQPALSFEKRGFARARNPLAIRDHIVGHAQKRLGQKMGDKYRNLVLKCLRGDFEVNNDTKEDLKLQQAFKAEVVGTLQKITQCI